MAHSSSERSDGYGRRVRGMATSGGSGSTHSPTMVARPTPGRLTDHRLQNSFLAGFSEVRLQRVYRATVRTDFGTSTDGEESEQLTQELVLQEDGWRIVASDEQVEAFTGTAEATQY